VKSPQCSEDLQRKARRDAGSGTPKINYVTLDFLTKKLMPRILAIDYGEKRTGIAVTDELQIIASGLTTIPSDTAIDFLKKYFEKEKVIKVLIGEPRQMDNTPSQSTGIIEAFVAKFTKIFPDMAVIRVDERFTSKLAFQSMIDSGLKKKQRQNKGLIDEISATIMLQDYLSRKMI
jgi:putative Holliday junction resolvase